MSLLKTSAGVDLAILGVALGSVAFVGIIIFLVWFFLCRPKNVTRQASSQSQNVKLAHRNFLTTSDPPIQVEILPRDEPSLQGARIFDIGELYMATGDFSSDNFIREGRFGWAYRGILSDGKLVVVKMRKGEKTKEFSDRACYISSIRHQNLVTLLGYCQQNSLQILVYEYIPMGSVAAHLFCDADQVSPQMREFKHRLSIAIGAAKGLAYLHFISTPLIHREFKTGNVLVDENFEGKVVGAGDLKFLRRDDLQGPSSEVAGHDIFLAPEVMKYEDFSTKSDAFSFGVFLLELLSGRHATESPFPDSSANFVEWARNNGESDEITKIADDKLGKSFTVEGMGKCMEVVIDCVHCSITMRPNMSHVVTKLERILEHESGIRRFSTESDSL